MICVEIMITKSHCNKILEIRIGSAPVELNLPLHLPLPVLWPYFHSNLLAAQSLNCSHLLHDVACEHEGNT